MLLFWQRSLFHVLFGIPNNLTDVMMAPLRFHYGSVTLPPYLLNERKRGGRLLNRIRPTRCDRRLTSIAPRGSSLTVLEAFMIQGKELPTPSDCGSSRWARPRLRRYHLHARTGVAGAWGIDAIQNQLAQVVVERRNTACSLVFLWHSWCLDLCHKTFLISTLYNGKSSQAS